MKYVKLKDGRVMTEDKWNQIALVLENEYFMLCEDDVCKRSERLKTLFDYVFYKVKKGKLSVTRIGKGFPWKALKQAVIKGDIEYVKFANLTAIGLIFEAKMNKKGEIQLL